MGVIAKDPNNPNRLTISVSNIVEIITNEDTKKLRKSTKACKEEERAAKLAGMKQTMKRALTESDPELRTAYELWIDGMIDAANCRFTKAVVQLFEKTVTEYTSDKSVRLKIIEIATTNSYRDAGWAINKLPQSGVRIAPTARIPQQKVCTGTAENVTF